MGFRLITFVLVGHRIAFNRAKVEDQVRLLIRTLFLKPNA